MTLTLDQILSAALALEPKQRESLAEELLLSIDREQSDAMDAVWIAEARRRDAELAAGRARLVPIDEAIARVRSGSRR